MDRKKWFRLDNDDDISQIFDILNEIDDNMAINSDDGGDSDAEDDVPMSMSSSMNSTSQLIDNEELEVLRQMNPTSSDEVPSIPFNSELLNDGDYVEKEEEDDDENTSSDEDDEFIWQRTSTTPAQFQNFKFDRPFGVSNKITFDIQNVMKSFYNVLTPTFLQYIVDQSNLYASQRNQELHLSLEELKAYVGILIIMGFHSLPSMRLYWSSDCNFVVPRIQQIMPLKRFLKITRLLHFNDNSKIICKGEDGYDKLYKIRPFLDYANKRFPLLFHPSRYLSVDESMIKFKGRSSLKQYMPMKPIKRGFKVWVIACAVSGYCLGLSVYEGAELNSDKTMSLGEKVVNKLSSRYKGFGYCLFFDNFFSSIMLAKNLLQKFFFLVLQYAKQENYFQRTILNLTKN